MQYKYKRAFNKQVGVPAQKIKAGSLVFARKKYYTTVETKHKLASTAEGSYTVVSVTPDTVLIQDSDCQERGLRDRAVKTPNPAVAFGKNIVVQQAPSGQESGTDRGVETPRNQGAKGAVEEPKVQVSKFNAHGSAKAEGKLEKQRASVVGVCNRTFEGGTLIPIIPVSSPVAGRSRLGQSTGSTVLIDITAVEGGTLVQILAP